MLNTNFIEKIKGGVAYPALVLFCCVLIFCSTSGTRAQAVTSQQNRNSDNMADKNLRGSSRVNPSTLAMELSIPLMNYPGRAGNSMPFGFNYSSKIWRMDDLYTSWYTTGYSGNRQYVTYLTPRYSERSIGGWTGTISPPVIEEKLDIYDQYGKPIGNEFDEVFLPSLYGNLTQNFNSIFEHALNQPNLPCGDVCVERDWFCIFGQCVQFCSRWDYNSWCEMQCPSPNVPCWPGGDGPSAPTPRPSYYIKRVHLRTSDGSTHEFRKSDSITPYCYSLGHPNNGPGCDPAGMDRTGTFLAVDGSGMRLERTSTGSTLYLPNGSIYKFPSESQHLGMEVRLFLATEFQDVNGNKTVFSETVSEDDQYFLKQTDTMGREITDALPLNFGVLTDGEVKQQNFSLPGVANDTQDYKLIWKRLKKPGCEADEGNDPTCVRGDGALQNQNEKLYYDTQTQCLGSSEITIHGSEEFLFPSHGWGLRSCSSYYFEDDGEGNVTAVPNRFNPVVLGGIELPNGKTYTFLYNQWGEITKIVYPTGSREEFEYGIVYPLSPHTDFAYTQTNRGVRKHRIYDADNVLQQSFEYEEDATGDLYKITIKGSKADNAEQLVTRSERYLLKGSSYGEQFGFDSPLAGMPADERTFDENGVLRSRTLTEWTYTGPLPGGQSQAKRDARPLRSISIIIEGNDALATLSENIYQDPVTDGSPTDLTYFASLNVKEKRAHHYRSIPLGIAQTGSFAAIAAYFDSSSLASVSQTEYSYDPDYKDRGIIGLPAEIRSLDPANPGDVLAKSRLVYDEGAYPVISAGTPATWADPGSDLRGNPTTSRTWVKETNSWLETHAQFDNFGNLRKAWDASGDPDKFVETEFSSVYNYAYATKVTAPAPDPDDTHGTNETSSVETAYDYSTGLALTVTDGFGQIIRTEYDDPLLRPTRVFGENFTAPIAETIYDDTALTVKVRKQLDENNWDEATTYSDSLGRTVKTVAKDSEGDVTVETHYDLLGRVDRVTNPYRAGDTVYWNKTRYDEAGRAVESYAPATLADITASTNLVSLGITSFGISTVSNYVGTVVTTTDASGRKGRSITNALGQLLRVDEPTAIGGTETADLGSLASPAQPTLYTYDPYSNMVKVTQGAQNRYFKYNSLGRLIRVNQPEQEYNPDLDLADTYNTSGQWTAAFTYDNLGNVTTATDAKGVIIANTYDRAGRVTTRAYYNDPAGTPVVNFFYDGKGLDAEQAPNYAKGKLTKVYSDVSQTRYTLFDNFGRLKEMEQRTPAAAEAPHQATPRLSKYAYNLSGALVEETYPSGRVVRNSFESDGDIAAVSSRVFNGDYRTYASGFGYTAAGAISRMMLGNGRWETAQFNTRQQVTQLGLGASAANTSLWKNEYQYGELNIDGSVNTVKNTGNIARQTLTIPGASFIQSYKYDALYRLTEAKEVTGPNINWTQTFGYDIYGNRTSFSQTIGSIQTNGTPTINPNTNRFTSSNFTYDKNGNVTKDIDPVTNQARQFVFNGDNKQTEVKDANGNPIGNYYYDGEGKRVKKVTATETTIFVYSGGKLVAEYSTYISQNPEIKYLTEDHLGTPRVITNQLGQVIGRRDFMPFGENLFVGIGGRTSALKYGLSSDDIKQKFTGYQKDDETSLDFAEERMYNSSFGRFTAVDPLMSSGRAEIPQTWNRYVYCLNNPIVCTDPSGMDGGVWAMRRVGNGTELRYFETEQEFFDNNALDGSDFCKKYGCTLWDRYMEEYFLWADQTVSYLPRNSKDRVDFSVATIGQEYWDELVRSFYSDNNRFTEAQKALLNALKTKSERDAAYQREVNGDGTPDHPGLPISRAQAAKKVGEAIRDRVFTVGDYNTLRKAAAGSGLNAHHVGQKALMQKLVPGYDPNTGPAILVPFKGHTERIANDIPVLRRNTQGFTNARQVLARDIIELRRVYPSISNSELRELIHLNRTMYPNAFFKPPR